MNEDILLGLKLAITNTEQELTNEIDSLVTAAQKKAKAVQLDLNIDEGLKKLEKTLNGKLKGVNFNPELKKFFEAFSSGDIKDIGKAYEEINNKALLLTKTLTDAQLKLMDGWSGEQVNKFVKKIIKANEEIEKAAKKQSKYENIPEYVKKTRASENSIKKTLQGKKNKSDEEILDQFERAGLDVSKITKKELSSFTYYEKLLSYQKELIENDKALANPKAQKEADAQIENAQKLIKVTELLGRSREQLIEIGKKLNQNEDFTIDEVQSIDPNLATKYAQEWNKIVDKAIAEIKRNINSNLAEELEETSSEYLSAKVERNTKAINQQRAKRAKAIAPVDKEDVGTTEQYTEALNGVDNELDDVQEGVTTAVESLGKLKDEFKDVEKYLVDFETALKELNKLSGKDVLSKNETDDLIGYISRINNLDTLGKLTEEQSDRYYEIVDKLDENLLYQEYTNLTDIIKKKRKLEKDGKPDVDNYSEHDKRRLNILKQVEEATRLGAEAYDKEAQSAKHDAEAQQNLANAKKEVAQESSESNNEQATLPASIDIENLKEQLQEVVNDFDAKFSDAFNNNIKEFSNNFSNIDYYQALEPLRRELLNIVQQFKNSLKDLGIENSDLNKLYETLDAWNVSSHISTEDDRERLMLGNIKSGKTSVAVSGSEASISGELQQRLLTEVSKRIDGNISDIFDMWIHSHPLRDFLPNSKTRTTGADIGFSYGDLQSELNHYFEQGIKKMLVANNGKYSMLDFSKISKEVLEKFISQLAANLEKSGNFSIETDKIFKNGKGKIKDVAINRNAYVKDGVADLDKKSELINNAIIETINSSKELKQIIFETGDIADLKIDEVVQDEKNLANQSEELLNILNQIRNILNDMSTSGGGNSNLSGIFNIHLIADVDYLIERIQGALDNHNFNIKVDLGSGQSLDGSDEGAINTEGSSADRATDSLHALNYEKSENIELNAKLKKNANESAKALANEAEKAEMADKALTELNKRKRANNKLNEEKSEETPKEDSVELDSTVKGEATTLSSLIEPLNNIKAAIVEKNKAFIGEEEVVKEVTTSEFDHLGLVYDMINEISQTIENLNKKFGDLSLGQLNELIKKFKSNKTNNANIDGIVENLTKLADRLNTLKIDDSGIIDSITRIVDASKQLKDAVKDAEKVKEAVDKSGGNKSKKQKERTAKDIFKDQLKYQKQYIDLMNKSFSENGLTPKDAGKLVEVKQHLRDIADEFANIDFNTKEAKNAQDEYNRKINDYIDKVGAENRAAEKIQAAGNFESALSDLKNLSKKINDITEKTGKFRAEFRNKAGAALVDTDSLNNLDDINEKIKEYNNLIEESRHKENLEGTFLKLQKYQSNIADILSKNTAMPRELQGEFKALQGVIDGMIQQGKFADSEVIKVQQDFEKLNTTLKESGKTGKSFFDTIGNRLKDMNAKFIAQYFSFQDILRYGREIINTVKEIDTALTELRKVSNASDVQLSASFEEASKTAKELGSSITDVVNATSDWSRLGYSIDEANKLAEVSTLFVNVGDNVTMEDVNQSLISTLKGFNMEAENAIDIVDKFNEVANNFPIDTAGIGEALQRSAASFNAANTDLSKSIALVTATNSVLQNPESVGTMWKTLSARIRGAKTELQDLGEEQDAFTESTSKLRDLVKGLTGFDIMEDEDTFKDIYDIIIGIGDEWENLSDIEQASLGEALAGKRNSNAFFAVMSNLDMLKEAYETAENSAGSAQKEQENYMRSIQYSLDSFQASWQKLQADFLDTQLVKNVVNFFTKIIDLLDEIVNTFGSIPVAATGGILGFLLYNKTKDKVSSIKNTTSEVRNLLKSINDLTVANQLNAASEEEKAKASKDAAAAEITETEANTADTASEMAESEANTASAISEANETKENIKATASEIAEAEANMTSTTTEGLETFANGTSAISENAETISNISSAISKKMTKAGESLIAIGETLLSVWPITIAVAAIGAAAFYKWYTSCEQVIKRTDEAIDKMFELRDAFQAEADVAKESAESLEELFNQYKNAVKGSTEYYKIANKIAELEPSLVIGFTSEGDAILATNDAIQDQIKYYRDLAEEKRKAAIEENEDIINQYASDEDSDLNTYKKKVEETKKKLDEYNADIEAMKGPKGNEYAAEKFGTNVDDQLRWTKALRDKELKNLEEYTKKAIEVENKVRNAYASLLPTKDDLSESEKLLRDIVIDIGVSAEMDTSSFNDLYAKAEKAGKEIFDKLFNLQNQDLSPEQYQKQAEQIFNELVTALHLENDEEGKLALRVSLKIDEKSLADAKQKAVDWANKNDLNPTHYDERGFKIGNDDAVVWYQKLNEEQQKIANSDEFSEELERQKLKFDNIADACDAAYEAVKKYGDETDEQGHKSVKSVLEGYKVDENTTGQDKLDEYYKTADAVDEIIKKISNGDYTDIDLAQWRVEYDLVGETAEELTSELNKTKDEAKEAAIAVLDELIEANPNDKELIKSLNQIKESLENISKESKKLKGNANIANIVEEFEKLSGLYETFKENSKSGTLTTPISISDVEALREVWGDLASFEEFERLITTTGSSAAEVEAAFDQLSTEFANTEIDINHITEATKAQIASQLELAGATKESAQAFVDYYANANKVKQELDSSQIFNELTNDAQKQIGVIEDTKKKLEEYSKGGNVDLTIRPKVDTKELEDAGWKDVGEGIATVFSSSFTDDLNTKTINFTPIIVDENGNKIGIMSPKKFDEYCFNVVNGVHDDYLKLQIGAEFKDADEAGRVADEIHRLHEVFYNLVDPIVLADDAIEDNKRKLEEEAEQLGITTQALAYYVFEEQIADMAKIDTASEVSSLIALAGQANITGECLEKLIELEEIYIGLESGVYGKGTEDMAKAMTRANELQKEIQGLYDKGAVKPEVKVDKNAPKLDFNGAKGKGGSGSEQTPETFDWIETKIQRLERDITNLGKTADATYKTWAERTVALGQEMEKVNEQISLQETAYNAYMAKAESVGLSAQYKKLVQSGALKIDEITDETLKEQISNYKEWYIMMPQCLVISI